MNAAYTARPIFGANAPKTWAKLGEAPIIGDGVSLFSFIRIFLLRI